MALLNLVSLIAKATIFISLSICLISHSMFLLLSSLLFRLIFCILASVTTSFLACKISGRQWHYSLLLHMLAVVACNSWRMIDY